MRRSKLLLLLAALGLLAAVAACGSSSGSGGDSSSYGTWIDANRNSIYDPYEDPTEWQAMMATTGGLHAGMQDQANQNQQQHQIRHQWRDSNGDGICDYAQNQNRWQEITTSQWIDQNGDGICDNYPGRPQDGSGNGWKGGWR